MDGVRGHHEWRSGLITIALDTTDAATKSNSLLPFLPQQCGGSLPAAVCCCWRWWRMALQEDSSAVHVHCELWKRLVYYPVCHQNIIKPHWTSFLTSRKRRDDSMTKVAMTSWSLSLQRQIRASLLTPHPQLIFGNSHTALITIHRSVAFLADRPMYNVLLAWSIWWAVLVPCRWLESLAYISFLIGLPLPFTV